MVLGDPETLVAVGLSRAGGIDGVEHGLVLAAGWGGAASGQAPKFLRWKTQFFLLD